ncbi:alpha/beta hydrolase [Shewanella indica]|uniref:Alpha/beta hydrolase n=1 Tax=Shewanella indica TaxID=768528 RepID=A0ABU4QFR5_9GAMM|nr:alpha/beta hydrolase [Shewanella indica]MDX6017661.1 alpha/beta hydrolase [Shewanella indica]
MTEQQTWVLIRGLMRDKRHWQAFADNLLALGFRVELIDLPGNGDRVADISPWDIQDYADFVADELLRRKVAKCRILAISMGAMVAMALAGKNDAEDGRQKEFQIEGLLLLNSSAADLSPWYQRFRLQALLQALCFRVKGEGIQWREATILALTSLAHAKDKSLCRHWSQLALEAKTTLANGLRQIVASARFRSPANLRMPAVIVYGCDDRLVSPKCSVRLGAKYRQKPIPFCRCGHDVALDRPELLLELVQRLSRQTP